MFLLCLQPESFFCLVAFFAAVEQLLLSHKVDFKRQMFEQQQPAETHLFSAGCLTH